MRQDLIALTVDDLVTLTNRGIARRAQKELDKFTFELSESSNGTVTVQWSDGVECTLPTNKPVNEWQCNCAATSICRHLIRSILAYQKTIETQIGRTGEELRIHGPWDPGQILDETLAKFFRKAALTRTRALFEEGHVIELVRSSKPTARIHTLSLTVRFLVPGDVRYTHCDCEGEAPCKHVPLAVWAFRLLKDDQFGGIVSTRKFAWPVPTQLLDGIERSLQDLAEMGMSGTSQALIDRLRRLEAECLEEGLIWPAGTIAEIIQEHKRYTDHDARFSPRRVAELVGELCIRSDAIRSSTDAVPQIFVRGSEKDRETRVGTARLVGLGCGLEVHRGSVTLSAYLQDTDSGAVVAVRRDFADPSPEEPDPPLPFWKLSQRPVIQRVSLASLGSKQLLIRGGKRLSNYQFLPGRAKAAVNPQTFNWETLRTPTLAEDFGEVRARLSAQPPSSLRPRRITENLYVCPVADIDWARFSVVEQEVQALLRDSSDEQAVLIHPYTSRGQEGAERLLATLTSRPDTVRFVAGRVWLRGGELIMEPVSVVLQEGSDRTMLQPWVDRWDGEITVTGLAGSGAGAWVNNPVLHYPSQMADALGDLFLTGLQRADIHTVNLWRELYDLGAALGFVRFLNPTKRLMDALSQKLSSLQWDWQSAARATIEMALLVNLAQEEMISSDRESPFG